MLGQVPPRAKQGQVHAHTVRGSTQPRLGDSGEGECGGGAGLGGGIDDDEGGGGGVGDDEGGFGDDEGGGGVGGGSPPPQAQHASPGSKPSIA